MVHSNRDQYTHTQGNVQKQKNANFRVVVCNLIVQFHGDPKNYTNDNVWKSEVFWGQRRRWQRDKIIRTEKFGGRVKRSKSMKPKKNLYRVYLNFIKTMQQHKLRNLCVNIVFKWQVFNSYTFAKRLIGQSPHIWQYI